YLRASAPPGERERSGPWWLAWRTNPSLAAGAVALALGLAVAAPWHLRMIMAHGSEILAAGLAPFDARRPGGPAAPGRLTDLAHRSVPIRTLNWLAPATAVALAWWYSANLRGALGGVLHGRTDATTALGLHLALDLLIAVVFLTRVLDRWAYRRDDRQRRV